MSDTEASTNAENPTENPAAQIDAASLSNEAAQAFDPQAATPANKQKSIMAAWEKAQVQTGEVNFDEPLLTPLAKAKEEAKQVSKPSRAKPVVEPSTSDDEDDIEPEVEVEADAAGEEAEEEASKPSKKDKPGKLTQAESRALIEQRVQLNQRFQRRDQQWQAAKANAEAQLNARASELEPIQNALKLFEAGDLDGFATTLGAITKDPSIKDWNSLNAAAINAVANPMYKRMRLLERQSQERAEEAAKQAQAYQAQQAELLRQKEVDSWKQTLADEANSDEDPAIGNLLVSRPQMVDALFNVQQAHYHRTGGELLSARDAATQLLHNVREDYKFWSNYFEEHSDSDALSELLGDQEPNPVKKQTGRAARVLERQTVKKTSGAAVATKPQAKPIVQKTVKNISQAQTASASAMKPPNEAQLKALTIQRMEEEFRAQTG